MSNCHTFLNWSMHSHRGRMGTSKSSIQSGYRIAKTGAKIYRGSLFMAAMSAVRYDVNFKAFYERLKANGKHTTQAQIAVMRKLIITAHSLYKNNRKYDVDFHGNEALL